MRTFLLRMPNELHARLKSEALAAGLSMQELCLSRLEGEHTTFDAATAAVSNHAHEMFGQALVGIIIFGSFARGEATQHSDVDVMLVIERSVPITRELYRRWDATPHSIGNRSVDIHFAHLPQARVSGGVWAEAAIDGLIVADRDRRIARALAAIRADIADGFLRRHAVHGQSYWTTAA